METPTTLRKCTRCGELKATDSFARVRKGRDGLHSYCRQCMTEYMAGRREHVGHQPRPCEWCEQEFTPHNALTRFCSNNCKMRARYWRLNPRKVRQCAVCGADITHRRRETIYCSHNCAEKERRNTGRGKTASRKHTLKRFHQLTPEEYEQMVASQNGRCAICRRDDPGTSHGYWHIDHDHQCCPARSRGCGTCVRGLLCSSCNLGLGHFKDDPVRLQVAIVYLSR